MRIVLYFLNWNDKFYLPFIKEHYGKFCERIVMYDQYSTDGSTDIARSLGFEVRHFGNATELNDQWYLDVKNNCWKECRGKGIDYVIVCDADEFLSDITKSKFGIIRDPIPKVTGFNMISEDLPVNSMFELSQGAYSESYSKQIIFNPDAVKEINYVHGCHKNNLETFTQNIPETRTYFTMFHFRMIGGVDRLINRHEEYRKRLSTFNKKHSMGYHYLHADEAKREEWKALKEISEKLW